MYLNPIVSLSVNDPDQDGRLTGPDAVKFFGLSQLQRAELKQVGEFQIELEPLDCNNLSQDS